MKRIVSFILVALMLIFATIPAYAANSSTASAGIVSPQFIGITTLSANLSIDSSGRTTSTGIVRPSNSNYTSYLTVSLQKFISGSWTTINSWSGSGAGLYGVTNSGSYYVGSGTYRACSIASIYNSSGSLVDTATAYSAEKSY